MVNVLEYDHKTGNVTLAGSSSDTKPVDFPAYVGGAYVGIPCIGSSFLEVDTQNVMFWDGTNWV